MRHLQRAPTALLTLHSRRHTQRPAHSQTTDRPFVDVIISELKKRFHAKTKDVVHPKNDHPQSNAHTNKKCRNPPTPTPSLSGSITQYATMPIPLFSRTTSALRSYIVSKCCHQREPGATLYARRLGQTEPNPTVDLLRIFCTPTTGKMKLFRDNTFQNQRSIPNAKSTQEND